MEISIIIKIYKRYEGDLLNGTRHGRGIMYYANGDKLFICINIFFRYIGEFYNDSIEGFGTMIYTN